MMDKERRFLLWIGWVFDALLWIFGGLMLFVRDKLRGILLTYENQFLLNDAKFYLLLGTMFAWLIAVLLLLELVAQEWYGCKHKVIRVLECMLHKVSQTALNLAAKVAPKTVSQPKQQSSPPVPVAKPTPPPRRNPPPPPDPPTPPRPPRPRPEPPKPPPPDLTSSRVTPGPDLDPNSGGAALPIPTQPIHRMAGAGAAA